MSTDKPKLSLAQRFKRMGPAAIITSAFIGPGTVVTASVSGASFGYSLLWVVLLAGIALMILMEMSSRIGIAGKSNMIEAAISVFPNSKAWSYFVKILIGLATLAICFAFEAGNIAGASAGLADISGMSPKIAAIITAVIAIVTVFLSSYTALSRLMQFFVSAMGIIFVLCAVAVLPNLGQLSQGLFIPSMPEGSVINALALVGTTLIGINLVLHSITSQEKWAADKDSKQAISDARFDIIFNIAVGMIISMSIIIVAAAVLFGTGANVNNALVFTKSLEPVLGSWARIVGDIGLFAAGLSSAIAVPFTMRAILSKIFKWEKGIASVPARILGTIIVLLGLAFAFFSISPIQIIIFAQATSGFLLPFIAVLLLVAANSKAMGEFKNKAWQNIAGILATTLAFILGFWGLYNVVMRLLG